jgi:hypothetical protein
MAEGASSSLCPAANSTAAFASMLPDPCVPSGPALPSCAWPRRSGVRRFESVLSWGQHGRAGMGLERSGGGQAWPLARRTQMPQHASAGAPCETRAASSPHAGPSRVDLNHVLFSGLRAMLTCIADIRVSPRHVQTRLRVGAGSKSCIPQSLSPSVEFTSSITHTWL